MFDYFFELPFWQVFAMSDWVSKYIIMLGLFILSVTCLAIIIVKYIQFKKEKLAVINIGIKLKKARTLSDVAAISKAFDQSVTGGLLSCGLQHLKVIINNKSKQSLDVNSGVALSDQDFLLIENNINQELNAILIREEGYLPVLGTSASVSPLLGLFGTLWGLIHSFIGISNAKSADIAAIAPGIAAALLTTLAGLVVAIPAMVAFHYFSNELRKREVLLLDVVDTFLVIVRQSFAR